MHIFEDDIIELLFVVLDEKIKSNCNVYMSYWEKGMDDDDDNGYAI